MVQYVEAHDNLTLYDKLKISMPWDDEDSRMRRHLLASSFVLLSQGIPFIHAGQEFMRTKNGLENSYNAPDSINRIDWHRRSRNETGCGLHERLDRVAQARAVIPLADH
jgi:pullulanase